MLTQIELKAEADRLYERFVKPLEAEHWGEVVAVNRDGCLLLGEDTPDFALEAERQLGRGYFLFAVGPRVLGHI